MRAAVPRSYSKGMAQLIRNDRLSPAAALSRLLEGNGRFLARAGRPGNLLWPCDGIVREQRPFAVVLGCSDSRMPVEILFDQGFGDLFVIRVAGNVLEPSIVGSVEFALERFGVGLVLVLGHTRCGAVDAALDLLCAEAKGSGPNLAAITSQIVPSIAPLLPPGLERSNLSSGAERAKLAGLAMRAHVRATLERLRGASELVARLTAEGRAALVGAEYRLETGEVKVLGDGPERDRWISEALTV